MQQTPTYDVVLKLSGSHVATARALERLLGSGYAQGTELLSYCRDHLAGRAQSNGEFTPPTEALRTTWQDGDNVLNFGMGQDYRVEDDDPMIVIRKAETGAEILIFRVRVGASRQKRNLVMYRGHPQQIVELLPRLWAVQNCFWRTDGTINSIKGSELADHLRDQIED